MSLNKCSKLESEIIGLLFTEPIYTFNLNSELRPIMEAFGQSKRVILDIHDLIATYNDFLNLITFDLGLVEHYTNSFCPRF